MKNILFFILLLLPFLTIGQSYPKTINLDVDDGLIQSTVWAIEEDNLHRIWIGTPGGIQVYDGFNLITLPELEGTILRLQKHDSSIYCITISALYKFNQENFSFTKVSFPRSYFYISEFSDKGIALFNDKNNMQFFYNYNLKMKDEYLEKRSSKNHFFKFSLSGKSIFGDIEGLITEDSIPLYSSYCKQFVKYNSQRAFVASHNGLIEIVADRNKIQIIPHFIDLRVMHLLVDYNKNLWVATADNGIFMIHRNSLQTNFFPKSKANGDPLSCWRFSEINKQLYTSSFYGLIPVEQNEWQNNDLYLSTKNLACNDAIEGDGFILIGTRSDGIYKLKNNRLKQVFINPKHRLDNIIIQIEKNKNGFLASSKYSLIQLDEQGTYVSQVITDFDSVFGYTMEFYQFANGIMNARTTGVVELDADFNIKQKYKSDSIQVVSMVRPYQNSWWGVSMDAGLLKIENNQLVKVPFPDKHLFTLTNWNDTNLWISGIHGVYQYSEKFVRPFLQQNGFPLKEYNQNAVFKDSIGNLYVAGVGGIQKFDPDSLLFFPQPPEVLVEHNEAMLNPANITKLHFDQSQIILNIHPIIISDQNYFKIEVGNNNQWITVSQPKQLSFNLATGNTIIKIKITDLVHNKSKIVNYTFHRAIPFWQKTWFIVFTILIIILIIVGIFSFIGYVKTKKKNRLAQIRIEEQQKGLTAIIQAQESERKRIAEDLHDGIVQQLSGLKLGLQKVFYNHETHETNRLVNILDESANELRELSHKMMPRSLSKLGLVATLDEMLENSLGNTSITYQYEYFGINNRFEEHIEIAIYRIAQELINNIIKHSKAYSVV
jgi:ligand-binding sensor domain-containing protein